MSFSGILQDALSVAGTFDTRLIVALFLICAIGELGLLSVPYLLETIWLASGYNLGIGVLLPYHLALLWLVSQAGRQTGSTLLFTCGRFGSLRVMTFYQKYLKSRFSGKVAAGQTDLPRLFGGINYLSPVSIAAGRLIGLRFPLTLAVGANRRLGANILGIILSSLIWDGVYISLGVFGGRIQLKPYQMILYSLLGLTAIYAITLMVRYLRRRQILPEEPVSKAADAVTPDSSES